MKLKLTFLKISRMIMCLFFDKLFQDIKNEDIVKRFKKYLKNFNQKSLKFIRDENT